jgi:branched-chain amino acid transport system substrate-binding protein
MRSLRFAVSVLVAGAALSVTGAVAQERTVKITGFGAKSGVVRVFGINSEAAMKAAADEINKSGGVTLGDGTKAKFTVEFLDDRCNAE